MILGYLDFRKFTRKQKIHFIINLFIGSIIALCLHLLEHTDWGENTLNKAFDFVIAKEAGESARIAEDITSKRHPGISDRLAFVEIDQETHAKWGKPLITPRGELAKIIKSVYQGGAKIIVLDMLLEERDCCSPNGDRLLKKVLQDIAIKRPTIKVIFSIRTDSGGNPRNNIFHDLIKANPNFYTATASISATATDSVVRYWVPFETHKDSNETKILWNIAFLAAILADGHENILKEFEQEIKIKGFRKIRYFSHDDSRRIKISPNREDIYSNRIRFLLLPKNTLSYHPEGNLFDTLYGVKEIDHGTFKDKIVIIGNSSPDAGDIHLTPVGNMAGMFIIGNAVNTIVHGIQPARPSAWINIPAEIFAIVLAAFLFVHLHAFMAQIVGSILLILTFGIISYYYFIHTGIFLNFMFSVVGMGFHRIVANLEEMAAIRGQRQNKTKGG